MIPALEVQGLVTYLPGESAAAGSAPLHEGLDLSLKPGEIVSVEGPSGTGKTVLGTTLLRLRPPPAEGRILWSGEDVTELSAAELQPKRAEHQAMLQHTGALLPPYQTVRQGMEESLAVIAGREPEERVLRDVAERLGITHLLERYPRHLSGGEQRRASLARLMLVRPRLAFVDEPDAGLDAVTQVEIMVAIRALVEETGAAILLVTHQAHLAATFADRQLRLAERRLHEV